MTPVLCTPPVSPTRLALVCDRNRARASRIGGGVKPPTDMSRLHRDSRLVSGCDAGPCESHVPPVPASNLTFPQLCFINLGRPVASARLGSFFACDPPANLNRRSPIRAAPSHTAQERLLVFHRPVALLLQRRREHFGSRRSPDRSANRPERPPSRSRRAPLHAVRTSASPSSNLASAVRHFT